MSNPIDPLDGPDAPEWLAKEAVCTLIKNNAYLSSRVRTFLSYEGEQTDDSDFDNLARPAIRISVKPGESAWFAAQQHRFNVQFQIEMAVDSTQDRQILKLWHAVRTALSPRLMAPGGELTVLQVMMAAGMSTWKFSEAVYEIIHAGKGNIRYIYALGYCETTMLVNT